MREENPSLKFFNIYMIVKDLAGIWAIEVGLNGSSRNMKEHVKRGRERLGSSKWRTDGAESNLDGPVFKQIY